MSRSMPGGRVRLGSVSGPAMTIPAADLRVLAYWTDTFERGAPIGRWRGGVPDADGVIQVPWYEYSEEIERFTREMSEANFVQPVASMDWAGTPAAQRLIQDPATIARATHDELVYLLTTIIRGERFSDGEIAAAYERGTLLAIARRARDLLVLEPA